MVRTAWEAYRASDLGAARRRFDRALTSCPHHLGARVGRGFVALRQGADEEARRRFSAVLQRDSTVVDALVGMGILAWRSGELERVAQIFQRVETVDPDNETARRYLARLPAGLTPPPERPPLQRPDTLAYPARTRGSRFEVRTKRGWRPFYVKGVNLGAALPGNYPSQFPERDTYRTWIRAIAGMGSNAVRVYTIHPPAFYEALAEFNRTHPEEPLWLIQGVWTELPPGHDYDAPGFESGFEAEMERVVDVIHGRADLRPRPGHAAGHYVADVSDWALAYVIGREWESFSVEAYIRQRPQRTAWEGRFLEVQDGNAMDVWLARMCEHLIAYETRMYGKQRPVAYASWPTLDPLSHPTEATTRERWQIRKSLGDQVGSDPPSELDFDDDGISIDPSAIRATSEYPAGFFATYHVYPYYPDFLVQDPEYGNASSPFGPSNYFGYLRELKARHSDLPVLIGEYGVPTGPGVAHVQPQGWHHGGHQEEEMAEISSRLTREIAAAGMAGGVIFAWIDEWFKRNWLVAPYEVPRDRDRMWWNRMDPEENYGILALEPEPRIPGDSLSERRRGWRETTEAVDDWPEAELRTVADEAGLRFWFELDRSAPSLEILYLGIDVLDPDRGVRAWPEPEAGSSPVGLEFVAVLDSAGLQVLPSRSSRRYGVESIAQTPERPPEYTVLEVQDPPPGFFTGRWRRQYRQPRIASADSKEGFEPLRVVTNARRFGRDSTEFAALGYERGHLPQGASPDGFWRRSSDKTTFEIHIPWLLLNISDPSRKQAVFAAPRKDGLLDENAGEIGAAEDSAAARMRHVDVRNMRVVVAGKTPSGRWRRWPRGNGEGGAAVISWEGWDEPRWRSRYRPLYGALAAVFDELQATVTRPDSSGGAGAGTQPDRE